MPDSPPAAPYAGARKWLITVSVMLVTVMQVLDTSVMNVALPHMQGALSAGVEETSWVITSYLAANAVVIPATGWLTGVFGRRRLFLICTTLFTLSSFLSGLAPNLPFLVLMRVLQGLGGGPVIPMAQATMWEVFPLKQRGVAMAVWGVGIMMAPILGPTVGGWITDNWSWRWIFYINLPIGFLGFFMASAFLFDSPYLKRSTAVDRIGLALMVVGFGCLQLMLDQGEKEDWFDSSYIVILAVVGACALVTFLARQLVVPEAILDLSVFNNRNFALGATIMAIVGLGFYSSTLLLALYTQKLMGYDAWNSGLVLAPGGFGNMLSLIIAGRLVARVDQRMLLGVGCALNATAFLLMSNLTLGMDYGALAWPRFLQGLGQGFLFVPLQTLALATIRMDRLSNATAAFNVVRNFGGSVGVALATTLLARRSQYHQSTLAGHVNVWDAGTAGHLREWTQHFMRQGADAFTAERRALAMLYRSTVGQAQVLAYADEYVLISLLFVGILFLIPLLRRVRAEQTDTRPRDGVGRVEGLPQPAAE